MTRRFAMKWLFDTIDNGHEPVLITVVVPTQHDIYDVASGPHGVVAHAIRRYGLENVVWNASKSTMVHTTTGSIIRFYSEHEEGAMRGYARDIAWVCDSQRFTDFEAFINSGALCVHPNYIMVTN